VSQFLITDLKNTFQMSESYCFRLSADSGRELCIASSQVTNCGGRREQIFDL